MAPRRKDPSVRTVQYQRWTRSLFDDSGTQRRRQLENERAPGLQQRSNLPDVPRLFTGRPLGSLHGHGIRSAADFRSTLPRTRRKMAGLTRTQFTLRILARKRQRTVLSKPAKERH